MKKSYVLYRKWEPNEITCAECGHRWTLDFCHAQVCCPSCKAITAV